jgi:hypothetical protein
VPVVELGFGVADGVLAVVLLSDDAGFEAHQC